MNHFKQVLFNSYLSKKKLYIKRKVRNPVGHLLAQ